MSTLIKRLANDLLLSQADVLSLIKSAPMRYKVYSIEKRSGKGARTIAQPTPAVKDVQTWVVCNVLQEFEVHAAATAYRKGVSIFSNAKAHQDSRYLLKMDFVNFFNSITDHDFYAYLRKTEHQLEDEDIALLTRILFWKPKLSNKLVLSVGAPSSPLLSNILMYDFDTQIASGCRSGGINYTRYADDLTFSSRIPGSLREVEQWVHEVLEALPSPRLMINEGKTLHVSKAGSRRVTGLVLSNEGGVSVGRETKRILRATIHRFVLGRLTREEIESLRGWLAYINGIDPAFLARMKSHYGPEIFHALGIGGTV